MFGSEANFDSARPAFRRRNQDRKSLSRHAAAPLDAV